MTVFSTLLGGIARVLWRAGTLWVAFIVIFIESLWRAIPGNATQRPLPAPQAELSQACQAELSLPLLAARRGDLPYQVDSTEQVAASVSTLLADPNL